MGEAAVTAGQTDTFLGERYRRIARRRGKKKAIVAVGRSILIIVWHLLPTPTPASTTSAPTSTTPASAPSARNAPTSVNSKPLG
jgi:transposase